MTLSDFEYRLERKLTGECRNLTVFEWTFNGQQMFVERVVGFPKIPRSATPAHLFAIANTEVNEAYWIGCYTDKSLAEADALGFGGNKGGSVLTDPYSDEHFIVVLRDLDRAIELAYELLCRQDPLIVSRS